MATLNTRCAVLAAAKLIVLKLTPEDVDYLFESGIVTDDDITFGANFTGLSSMTLKVTDLFNKAKTVCKNKEFLKKLPSIGVKITSVAAACAAIPKSYSKDKVKAWKKMYELPFKI